MLHESLEDEKEADALLSKLAKGEVNKGPFSVAAIHPASSRMQVGALAQVGKSQLSDSRFELAIPRVA
jgi:hypothetical protein